MDEAGRDRGGGEKECEVEGKAEEAEEEDGVAGVVKKDGLVPRLRGEMDGDALLAVVEAGNE